MFILIIVDFNNLVERSYAFVEQIPLLTSIFKFIFYKVPVMIMLSVKRNAIHAKKLLFIVLATFLIAKENLDASPVALAGYVVSGCPIVYHR